MTAKEMAHWERWHRLGQRRFQWSYTLFLFGVIGFFRALVELFWVNNPSWWERVLTSALVSIGAYFLLGWIWKTKVAEYLRLHASAQDSRT